MSADTLDTKLDAAKANNKHCAYAAFYNLDIELDVAKAEDNRITLSSYTIVLAASP